MLLSRSPGIAFAVSAMTGRSRIDGNETTRRSRALPEGGALPVVFLTAKAMPGDRESSLAAGATDYVTKPVDLDELLVLMASWVQGRVAS